MTTFAQPPTSLPPHSPTLTLTFGTPARRRTTFLPLTPSRFPPLSTFVPPPLPPLSLRPLSSTPYAIDSHFAQERANDMDAIDFAVRTMRERASDRVKDLAGALAEIEGEKRRIEEMCRHLGELAREMGEGLKKERAEEAEARDKEKEVEGRNRSLKIGVEGVKTDIAEVQAKLAARRALKQKQREAFQRQTSKNTPELAFFEDKLGLKVRGKARDVVQFKFTNIDPGSYNRAFSFELDASQRIYSLTSISPSAFLPATVAQSLLDSLNKDRDLYAFVITMRAAFRDEVRLEKMTFAAAAEGEKVKDEMRTKLRGERVRR